MCCWVKWLPQNPVLSLNIETLVKSIHSNGFLTLRSEQEVLQANAYVIKKLGSLRRLVNVNFNLEIFVPSSDSMRPVKNCMYA
jgi:hypothetical protein